METRRIKAQDLDQFAQYLRLEEKSMNTRKKYIRDVKKFVLFLDGKHVEKENVIAYKQKLLDEGYSICSINSMVASVNSLLGFLGWTDCKIKFLKVQRQRFSTEDKELTKKEYARLVQTARKTGNYRLALLLQTICGTGIRVSELRYITVEGVKRGSVTVSLKGKSRKVFIVKDLQRKLLQYVGKRKISSGPVFVTKNGRPLSRTNVWREMKALCFEAKVNSSKVFPHNLRHLFARCFYGIEKDIAKLADILGHSSINTTRIYILTSDREHRQQMERLRLIL